MTITEREVTTALEAALIRRIGEPRYKLWFDRHTRFSWDKEQLTVGVPNRHFEEWLHKTFHDALAAAAREVFARPLRVHFAIDPQLFQAARREQAEVRGARSDEREAPIPHPEPRPAAKTKTKPPPKPAAEAPAPAPLPSPLGGGGKG